MKFLYVNMFECTVCDLILKYHGEEFMNHEMSLVIVQIYKNLKFLIDFSM